MSRLDQAPLAWLLWRKKTHLERLLSRGERCSMRTGAVHPRQAAFGVRLPWNMLSVSFEYAQAQCTFEKRCGYSTICPKSH